MANLSKMAIMDIRKISSTEAQNNFGKLLSTTTNDQIVFVIERRGASEVALISISGLVALLGNKAIRESVLDTLKKIKSSDTIGQSI